MAWCHQATSHYQSQCWQRPLMLFGTTTLKRKCRHFDEIFITGCTVSCHFDNFQCSQWWKFHQNEDISVSVKATMSYPWWKCQSFGIYMFSSKTCMVTCKSVSVNPKTTKFWQQFHCLSVFSADVPDPSQVALLLKRLDHIITLAYVNL